MEIDIHTKSMGQRNMLRGEWICLEKGCHTKCWKKYNRCKPHTLRIISKDTNDTMNNLMKEKNPTKDSFKINFKKVLANTKRKV